VAVKAGFGGRASAQSDNELIADPAMNRCTSRQLLNELLCRSAAPANEAELAPEATSGLATVGTRWETQMGLGMMRPHLAHSWAALIRLLLRCDQPKSRVENTRASAWRARPIEIGMNRALTIASGSPRSSPERKTTFERGLVGWILAAFRTARHRKIDRELAELIASRGGTMKDRCQRDTRRELCRSHPFRQLPALKPR
jgi:hypothetical protein